MSFDVRQMWSKIVSSKASGYNSKGTRVFTVVGTGGDTANEDTAIYASGIADINDTYDDVRTDLFCLDVTGRTLSLNMIEVTETYGALPQVTTGLSTQLIGWSQSTVTEQVDYDLDANPIINLNGQVLAGATRTFYIDVLSITVNLDTYDYSVALAFRNTVNDADIDITTGGDTTTVPAGYMRVASLLPTRQYTLADPFVPVNLSLEIYDGNALANPWQLRMVHKGSEAYCKDSGDSVPQLGRIVFAVSGQTVSHDVRLNLAGIPMETSDEYADVGAYAVKRLQGKAVSQNFYTSPLAEGIIDNLTITPDTSSSGTCVYMIYRRCYSATFSTLFSTLGIA